MKNTRWIVLGIVMGALTGCQQQTFQESKIEANKRWLHTRAQMQYGVAAEHLKAGQLDKAKLKAMEALALDENYAEARVLLGKVLIEQGQYGPARTELTKVCTQNPKQVEATYLLGVAQEKEGALTDALESYRKVIALDGRNVAAILAAAEVMVEMGQIREAQVHIENYMNLAPEDPGMCEIAGRLAMMQRDFAKAADHYRLACDQDPRNVFYQDALAKALYMGGRHKEAVEVLARIVAQKDYKPTASQYGMLGNCYLMIGRPKEARDAFGQQTQLIPNEPSAHVNLAKAAMQLGDYPRSIQAARQAIELDAGNVDAAFVMGYTLICDGQHEKAVSFLAKACETNAKNVTLQCLLGRAYAASGDDVQAVRCFNAALELDPKSTLAKELLASCTDKKVSAKLAPVQ